MTNMPTERHYWTFGIVTATVCVPFFVLLGSLNTTRGMHFWRVKTVQLFQRLGMVLSWLCNGGRKQSSSSAIESSDDEFGVRKMSRSTSAQNNRDPRLRRWLETDNEPISKAHVEILRQDTGTARPAMIASPSSNIAELWRSERKRTLSYSQDV